MSIRDVGRNDPCPCGSGKKYKKCCLGRVNLDSSFSSAGNILEELRRQSEEKPFKSFDEARTVLEEYSRRFNQTPLDSFHGLSPEQMDRFLYFPFDSPQLVEFPEELGKNPAAPVLDLFRLLAAAIPEKGLKPTAKGNLPRKVCREIALEYLGEDCYRDLTLYKELNSEEDYLDLNVVRIVSEQAGLIRKYKGKMILGRQCRKFLSESSFDRIYTRLFKTYAIEFYWEYRDPYISCDFIQDSFLFSLYLLAMYGDKPLPVSFYEDCFLQAFPIALRQVAPETYPDPETRLRCHYSERTLVDFFKFFGLLRAQPVQSERTFGQDYEVTKLPLLDRVVHFYLK
jgi:hypothetical protein